MSSARYSALCATLLALGVFVVAPLKAQIGTKATPYSFRATLSETVPTYTLPADRVEQAYQYYQKQAADLFTLHPTQHGLEVETDLGFENAGQWTMLEDGGWLWRLRITSKGATSLNLIYDDFWMPAGAHLHLYNEDHSVVLGAFTERNNKAYGGFATDILAGDATILEYYEPAGVAEGGRLHIASVVHGLLGGNPEQQLAGPYTPLALPCSINVACSSGRSKEIGATVKIVLGGGSCTGVLINNTEADEMPYVMTANHCGGAAVGQNVNWVFKFNYQSDTCADPAETPSSLGSITGGTVRAALSGGADYTLVELSEGIPENFDAYFAGWSLSDSAPSSGAVIGHPKGDIKKITLEDHPVLHSASPGYWEAKFDHGTIESSSSGSPLFDQAGLLRGILRASLFLDENACSGLDGDDNQPRILFPKLSAIWDMGTAGERISDFLDPTGSGTTAVGPLQATGENLPVELVSFEAILDGAAALLRWETASETNNAGFEIQSISASSSQWEARGYVEGHGTTIEPQTYTHRVGALEAGTHRFRLKQLDFDGTFEYSPEVEVAVGVPGAYHLSPAYPNPFNPETSFSLSVAHGQDVEVAVYNLLGQRVAHLFDGFMESESTRAFTFDAAYLPSGLYLIRVLGERFATSHTVTLLK